MNYNVANKFRGIHNGGGRGYVQYEPIYKPFNSLGKWGTDCVDEMPVCPPMFHFKKASIENTPNVPLPAPSPPFAPTRIKTLPVIKIDTPKRQVSGDKPSPSNSNWPGSGGSATGDEPVAPPCRQCGPKVPGVIGVSELGSVWPKVNDNGQEQIPFTVVGGTTNTTDFAGKKTVDNNVINFRSDGTYNNVSGDILYSNYYTGTINAVNDDYKFPTNDPSVTLTNAMNAGMINITNASNGVTVNDGKWQTFCSNLDNGDGGKIYWSGADGADGNDGNTSEMISFVKSSTGCVITRGLPMPHRTLKPAGYKFVIVLDDDKVENMSGIASLSIIVDGDTGKIDLETPGVYFSDLNYPLSRGRGYPDNSLLVIENQYLGSDVSNSSAGALLLAISTMKWPDADTSTCVVSSANFPGNTQKYCCSTGFLTPAHWNHGEGRCAPLANLQSTNNFTWPENCPFGYEYDPKGAVVDGLSCKRCESSTTSYDETVNPNSAACLSGGDGTGCQKCCEDSGREC